MRSRLLHFLVVVCVACVVFSLQGRALAIFEDEPGPADGVRIESMSLSVKVRGRLATTTMDLVFASTRNDAQGILQWRMAPDAAVHDLVLWVEGLRIPCEVCPRTAARATYDRIVAGRRDPAIVEYLGDGVWNLSVFPVSPGQARKVRVVYTQLLPYTDAAVYVGPRITKDSPCRKIDMLEFEAEIECPGGVKDFRSARKMGVVRQGRSADNMGKVVAGFRSAGWDPKDSVAFAYQSARPMSRVLSAPAEVDADGRPSDSRVYLLDPNAPDSVAGKGAKARNVVLVLDASGSMAGDPWKTARSAATAILANLAEPDRFSLVVCGPEPKLWEDSLWAPTAANIDSAKRMIRKTRPAGGTDLAGALRAAASFKTGTERLDIFAISDGWDHVAAKRLALKPEPDDPNDPNCPVPPCRIFALGVAGRNMGLEDLARRSGGAAVFVHEPAAVDNAMSLLLAQMRRTDVTSVLVETPTVAAQRQGRQNSDDPVLAMLPASWPGVVGWTADKGAEKSSLRISAMIDGLRELVVYNTLWLTVLDPDSMTSQDEENIRRIYAHLACQTRYPRIERPEATAGELAKLLGLCRRRHIASSGSALLVLESDMQYGEMGLDRARTVLRPDTTLAELDEPHPELREADDPEAVKKQLAAEKEQREKIDRLLAAGNLDEASSASFWKPGFRDDETPEHKMYILAVLELAELRRQQRRQRQQRQEMLERQGAFTSAVEADNPRAWYEASAARTPAQLVPTAARFAVDITPQLTQAEKEKRTGLTGQAPEIDFKQMYLDDAISDLGRLAKLNIIVRWPALKMAGVNELTKLTVSVKPAPAKETLQAVLSAVKAKEPLAYIVDGTDVIVSTEPDLPSIPVMRLYDLRPLLCGLPCYDLWLDWDPFLDGHIGKTQTAHDAIAGAGIFGDSTAGSAGGSSGPGSDMLTLMAEQQDRAEPGSVFEIWRKDKTQLLRVDRIEPNDVLAPSESRREDDYYEYGDYLARQRDAELGRIFPSRTRVAWEIVSRAILIPSSERSNRSYSWSVWMIQPNGLLAARQPQAFHARIARIIRELNDSAHNGKLTDAYLPHWPESIFSRQATIEQWTAGLLEKARAGTLSEFSSARIADLPGRRMVRIGGIWFDATLTADARIYTVARTSPAGLAVKKALGQSDKCFSLIGPVIIPAGPGMAVCLDRAGIRDEKDPDLKRLLAALKAKPTTRPEPSTKPAKPAR